MSTDKEAVRLAFHIIQHNFGPLVGKVARPLLHRGLLTLPQIHKLSLLPPSSGSLLRAALLLLAQHNLLWVSPPLSGSGEDAYELNTRAVFDLERVGRAVEGARGKWGDEAAEVVELLAGKGKACLAEVLAGLTGAGKGALETKEVTEVVEEEVSGSEDDSDDGNSSDDNSDSDDDASDSDAGAGGRSKASARKGKGSSGGRASGKPPLKKTAGGSRTQRKALSDSSSSDDAGGGSASEYESDASGSTRKRKRSAAAGKDKDRKAAKAKKAKKDGKGKAGKKDKGRRPKTVKRTVTRTVLVSGQGMDKKRAASIEQTLLTLLSTSHVLPAYPSLLTAPNFLRASLRADELSKLRGVVGPKDRSEAFARANVRIGAIRDEWWDWKRGLLPKKNAKPQKKVGSKAAGASGLADEPDQIDPAAYFYVNFDKFGLMMRNELVVKAAADRLNPEAAQIVLSVLSAVDGSSSTLAQTQSPPVTVHQIVHHLPPALKLHRGIFDPSSTLSSSSPPADLVACYCALLAAEDNPTASGLRTQILAKVKGGRDSSASYAIEFEGVCRRLKGRVLDSVVRERWGDDAGRVMAVVLKNGKMDEKHISKVAMLAPKDVRVITAALSASSLLELQEVPRSADRAPSRTFYLWHVDLARAYAAMVSHLYKTMANLIQRKAAELEKKRALVDRRNRVDVRESGGALLGELDKKEGRELDDKLAKLTLAEMRTDMNVFILRDLPGGPVGSTQVDVFDKA